jgi:hypothetical protein
MRFLSLAQFQYYLAAKDSDYKTFVLEARVRLWNGTIVPLSKYRAENKHIKAADLRNLHDHITTHCEYLTKFYNRSLQITDMLNPDTKPMALAAINNSSEQRYKNLVRNMFWREILRDTQNYLRSKSFLEVLEDLYKHNIINHQLLAPAALRHIAEGDIGKIMSFNYFRASIMNPYVVYSLQRKVFKSRRVFTPTLGWGSYFHGFVAGGVAEYVGVDVMPNVCKKLTEYAAEYHPEIKTQILCQPSESLLQTPQFMRAYHQYFDTVFCSPPYFRLELYNGGKQSTNEYPTYQSWLEGYWRATVRVCMHVLLPGGTMCYILGNYRDGSTNYNLVEDMGKIMVEEGFKYKRMIPMQNVNKKHDADIEKIVFFVK